MKRIVSFGGGMLCTLLSFLCRAAIHPNSLFADHMVLQQQVPVPLWGTGTDGQKVTVSFNGQQQVTIVQNGCWRVTLSPLTAGGPFTMTISADTVITIGDVLVGEVWICSGQSNMDRRLKPMPPQKPIVRWEEEVQAARYPEIRQFFVPHSAVTEEPKEDCNGKWTVCSPQSVMEYSAIGYFFARDLYKTIKVPLGFIYTAWGGTPAERWVSREVLKSDTALSGLVTAYYEAMKRYPGQLEAYKAKEPDLLQQWSRDSLKAVTKGAPLPPKPRPPFNLQKEGDCGGLYNIMVAPLTPYAIKGVCWYQGESNSARAWQYPALLTALINSWRQKWNEGNFPFLIVQIAPYKDMSPEIREAQLQVSQKLPNTALIVTTDCGDSADIHPTFKQPVGARLALAARAVAYHEPITYSGPVYKRFKIMGDKIILYFEHARQLESKGGPLKGFTIAGPDHQFVTAKAIIKGSSVEVTSSEVPHPVAARYGWSNVPDVNLYNEAGLPASPFRTGQ
ncbi:sialate O-acetylesterase [Niabella sp. CC-SYL272]|uniref:sialate O-acetylesterase n=1 Tax=Niabella agricola TaxID=2891571 RepID=UPI001F2568EF|nr:sialate O-acetylesterase [Niabella agricola]MCF3111261.1 sialate O-acetylesterase [Niabella agricola]